MLRSGGEAAAEDERDYFARAEPVDTPGIALGPRRVRTAQSAVPSLPASAPSPPASAPYVRAIEEAKVSTPRTRARLLDALVGLAVQVQQQVRQRDDRASVRALTQASTAWERAGRGQSGGRKRG